ncbi:hypothetical protein [Erythrobacter sp.]|uniref:hypothetical protein n=1 Tax=Erythrobacter sp. TaxID=1042 RepID=UPI0025EF296A|nr:hypothetical protein [Erythrobacter sp.]
MAVSAAARWCFGIGAAVCIAAMLGHELLGGTKVLDPLHRVDLPADVVWLHHFSWHVGSIALVAMAAMFVAATRKPEHLILAGFATAINAGFAVLGASLAVFGNAALWSTPAPYPWTLSAAFGAAGIYLARRDSRV